MVGPLRAKLFNLYFLFYMSSSLSAPRVQTHRAVKRTLVVLKSPFHYKSPKHHIQYSYHTIHASVRVSSHYYRQVSRVLSRHFLQNRAHRILLRVPHRLCLRDLVLVCYPLSFCVLPPSRP